MDPRQVVEVGDAISVVRDLLGHPLQYLDQLGPGAPLLVDLGYTLQHVLVPGGDLVQLGEEVLCPLRVIQPVLMQVGQLYQAYYELFQFQFVNARLQPALLEFRQVLPALRVLVGLLQGGDTLFMFRLDLQQGEQVLHDLVWTILLAKQFSHLQAQAHHGLPIGAAVQGVVIDLQQHVPVIVVCGQPPELLLHLGVFHVDGGRLCEGLQRAVHVTGAVAPDVGHLQQVPHAGFLVRRSPEQIGLGQLLPGVEGRLGAAQVGGRELSAGIVQLQLVGGGADAQDLGVVQVVYRIFQVHCCLVSG